jgi:hypothetical protein
MPQRKNDLFSALKTNLSCGDGVGKVNINCYPSRILRRNHISLGETKNGFHSTGSTENIA